jgi:hypothetical protein
MDMQSGSDRERFVRRAAEARAFVAAHAPELLGDAGADPSLIDELLERTPEERLALAERDAKEDAWLRSLRRADSSR